MLILLQLDSKSKVIYRYYIKDRHPCSRHVMQNKMNVDFNQFRLAPVEVIKFQASRIAFVA